MAQETKIRSLPRSNSKDSSAKPESTKSNPNPEAQKPARWIIYVGIVSLVLLGMLPFLPKPTQAAKSAPVAQRRAAAVPRFPVAQSLSRTNEVVSRYMQDAEMKHQMMVRNRELENVQFRNSLNEPDAAADALSLPDNATGMGVQMDADQSAERVYDDLNDSPVTMDGDLLPADRINARLANRKWVGEMERNQRIQFVRNYVRAAYDRGYEVEIDQNLVVVGLRKLNEVRPLTINQVIDRLAKQGY